MLRTFALAATLSAIASPALGQMTHPTLFCWADFGSGAINLAGLCNSAIAPATPTAAPPSGGGLPAAIEAAYLDATTVSPYGGQLASDVRGGQRDPYVDAGIYCDFVAGRVSAGDFATALAGQYPGRDQGLERDHWVIVGSVAEEYLCP